MNLSDLRTKPEQRHIKNQICNLLETMKNQMSEAARRKAREYQRLWRQRNPDKVRKAREYHRLWNQRNPDKVRQYNINYWERKANEDNIPAFRPEPNRYHFMR